MKHIIKVEVLENLPNTRPLVSMDANMELFFGPNMQLANEIWYTSSNGKVEPYSASSLPKIVSNTYDNGRWIIKFETDVTHIGDNAFYNCANLTSVSIPNSVTSIGDEAFYGCSGLTSPIYNAYVFAYMPDSYSGEYIIPDGIELIASKAFINCSGLTSVTIPNSITNIEDEAFWGCSSLTSITIPNSVTNIGGYAFDGCSGLTSVTIGNSVTNIGSWAFAGCESLTSITIPDSVTNIENNAFYNCTGLTSIICKALTPPSISGYNTFDSTNDCPIYVPENSVEAYKSFWPEYTNRIYAISE